MALVPPLSPPRFTQVPCPQVQVARDTLYFLILHPLRPFFVLSTVRLQQCHLSPIVCLLEVYSLRTECRPMPCCPWFPVQRPEYEGLPLHPHPNQVLSAAQVGGQTFILRDAGQETRGSMALAGIQSEGCRLPINMLV